MAQDEQKKADAKPDEGITCDVHKKNIGKILFSNDKITRGNMNNESVYKSTFNVGDIIYGRFYLAKGLNKYLLFDQGYFYENESSAMGGGGSWAEAYYIMSIDGKPYNDKYPVVYKSEYPVDKGNHQTTGQTRIIPNAADGGAVREVTDALNAMSEGSHQVRIDMYGGAYQSRSTKDPIATGTFTLVKAKGATAKMGKTFEDLPAGMKDAELEAKMLKAAQKKATDEHWKEKPMKVKISSEDWDVRRNELTGVVLNRVIRGNVYAIWPDGHCGYLEMSFVQNHDGTNFQNALYYNSIGGQYDLDCSK
ncbi:hypothetical protein GCM10023093_30920 [Nemorincola caseinilytica]|uniref:Lipoprotein n=2 Tax=Nemorincola caseinilytica TaxID=2054315 RepID=A0ABP8NRF6_9BACT